MPEGKGSGSLFLSSSTINKLEIISNILFKCLIVLALDSAVYFFGRL